MEEEGCNEPLFPIHFVEWLEEIEADITQQEQSQIDSDVADLDLSWLNEDISQRNLGQLDPLSESQTDTSKVHQVVCKTFHLDGIDCSLYK